jgi:uncharacterized lipoprotein NlpE involved in copper resistance
VQNPNLHTTATFMGCDAEKTGNFLMNLRRIVTKASQKNLANYGINIANGKVYLTLGMLDG